MQMSFLRLGHVLDIKKRRCRSRAVLHSFYSIRKCYSTTFIWSFFLLKCVRETTRPPHAIRPITLGITIS